MPGHWCLEPVGEGFDLSRIDSKDTGNISQAEAAERYQALQERLYGLQERFTAASSHALLLVLQGMDTSGKDGTIKKVVDSVNPQGVRLAAFKRPTPDELARDFLWRVHQQVPPKGQIGIFNRSHYEDVLIVRVKNLVPEKVWQRRYRQINAFERHLTETGTLVLKVFLHISRAEQKKRLEERLADPTKRWKFEPGDVVERGFWDEYQAAYQEAITRCSTNRAPWYVIPADRKWFRNWAVTQLLVEQLEALDPQYPQPDFGELVIPD